jgi:hypothetical protein
MSDVSSIATHTTKRSVSTIKRGALSDAEKERIEHLFSTLKKPYPAAIARHLNRAISTIEWHMMRNGMRSKPIQKRKLLTYQGRDGKTCYTFTPEHDAFIEARRVEGKPYSLIAKLVTAEFGFERKWYSVRTRLALLASTEGMD